MVAVRGDLGEADIGKLISMARFYLAEAFKHLERGDPYDAAEKVWASVKHATRALTLRFLGEDTPSPGETWRSFVTRAFMRAGLSFEDASRWAAYFVDVRGRLHGEVFYGLMYEEGGAQAFNGEGSGVPRAGREAHLSTPCAGFLWA
jgi:hypothetical protein